MMWWMNGIDYPLIIGGKPPYSLPSMIPIMFELTVLFSCLGTVLGMLHLEPPSAASPSDFRVRTASREFSDDQVLRLGRSRGPEIQRRERRKNPPRGVSPGGLSNSSRKKPHEPLPSAHASATFALLASAPLLGACRGETSRDAPIVFIRNMYDQPKYEIQGERGSSPTKRSMRVPVEGVVAREKRTSIRASRTGASRTIRTTS